MLNWIKDEISWDNRIGEVQVVMSDLTSAQERQFNRGFKELKDRGLVKRTKRSHYMINPNALIPLDYELALELWKK